MAKANYSWTENDSGERVFRVSNLQTRESIDVPLTTGLARVTGSGLHGARNNDELLVAKVVCDRNANVAEIKRWLEGPSRGATISALEAEIAFWKAKAAEAAIAAEARTARERGTLGE